MHKTDACGTCAIIHIWRVLVVHVVVHVCCRFTTTTTYVHVWVLRGSQLTPVCSVVFPTCLPVSGRPTIGVSHVTVVYKAWFGLSIVLLLIVLCY